MVSSVIVRVTRYHDHNSRKVPRQSKVRSGNVSWECVLRQIGKSQFGYVRPKKVAALVAIATSNANISRRPPTPRFEVVRRIYVEE